MQKHELLAPAGSLAIAKAVLDAGADAVYLAGASFGARAYASNLSQEELAEILDYAHIRGKRVHLTVNTLLKNRELEETLFSYIRPAYEQGLDAVIVQDFGVLSFLHRNFPGLSLHASTQMSVMTRFGAAFLKDCGVERIVTARELTLEEIRAIHTHTGMEIESFIHGALCYCFSGQCLMSSLFGGRSGNRGRCAQPCRLPYCLEDAAGRRVAKRADYPLSPKDLCALDLIPALCAAGVCSFKIEGRMKQLAYAGGVTEIYRRYLDLYEQAPEDYRVAEKDREQLLALGSRSGFTGGYYRKPWGRQMLSDRDSSHTGRAHGTDAESVSLGLSAKPKADMTVSLAPGKPVTLLLSRGTHTVSVTGEAVQAASGRPLSEADIINRMKKTGDTVFSAGRIAVHMDGACFLPVSALNRLRREGLARLKEAVLSNAYRTCDRVMPSFAKDMIKDVPVKKPGRLIQIAKAEMLPVVLEEGHPDCVLLDPDTSDIGTIRSLAAQIREKGVRAGICLPYCIREERYARLSGMLCAVPFDEYLVRSYDGIGLLRALGIGAEKIRLDAGVYVFSAETAAAFRQYGIGHYTMSYELNKKELAHQQKQGAMLSVYGRIPLMVSAQCVYRNYTVCRKKQTEKGSGMLSLRDRYGNLFFVDARCEDCYNIIYSNKPLWLADRKEELAGIRPEMLRLMFTTETTEEIRQVLAEIDGGGGFCGSRTRGHFNRGVE